jgi:hypothetical protein
LNTQVWRAYLEMESIHPAGGLDLFEAVAGKMDMATETVVEIVYYCGDCAQRRRCQNAAPPQTPD